MKKGGRNFFWPSYVDLMTSLFIIALVLFVISFSSYRTTKETQEKVKRIQRAVNELDSNYFSYSSRYQRFELNRRINFKVNEATIDAGDHSYLVSAGKSITQKLQPLIDSVNNDKDMELGQKLRFMIIVEGMASNDGAPDEINYPLSFNRARALINLWKMNGVNFSSDWEIQIAGSGIGGDGRYPKNGYDDTANQRILLHIIPKFSSR